MHRLKKTLPVPKSSSASFIKGWRFARKSFTPKVWKVLFLGLRLMITTSHVEKGAPESTSLLIFRNRCLLPLKGMPHHSWLRSALTLPLCYRPVEPAQTHLLRVAIVKPKALIVLNSPIVFSKYSLLSSYIFIFIHMYLGLIFCWVIITLKLRSEFLVLV